MLLLRPVIASIQVKISTSSKTCDMSDTLGFVDRTENKKRGMESAFCNF
jgi:hypothetical protein